MEYLEFTCRTPAEDLGLDEALLDRAELAGEPREVLRLWEPDRMAVVVGRSSVIADEVNEFECARRGVPILRRTSGGTSVVLGRGCLMYSVVLSYELRPALRSIDAAHKFVLSTVLEAVRSQVPAAELQGRSDLAYGGRKFSGNSLRCRRDHLLYHGTLLYDFPLDDLAALLGTPPRQPDYRAGRSHREFVENLPMSRAALMTNLRRTFQADELCEEVPLEAARRFAAEKFADLKWRDGDRAAATGE